MNIKFSPPDISELEIEEVTAALKSGWITTGPRVKRLEKQIAEYVGTPQCVCLNSQTACAEMALRILGIGEGDEVITSAYTYTATASVVCHVGAKLVLVDTQKDNLQPDYKALEAAITERTKAIIPVDIAGIPCDYDTLFSIVNRKKNLFKPVCDIQKSMGRVSVLADTAHAFGAQWHGKKVGSIADFSSFSFHAVKNFTTGEGGALTWRQEILEKIGSQQRLTFLMLAGFIAVLLVIILLLAQRLTRSVRSVVKIMQSAGEGRLQERVRIDGKMPSEVEAIARQYNYTMDRLVESVEREKELSRQRKDAEIIALEAQINPHFLYNTLDTINWIAIGRKEFDISRAITALARILRYGIDNSNGIVTIREEYEWLKQYLFLQQNRLKNQLESRISIPAEVMEARVHKLLFQPFIENSFVHGFEGVKRNPRISICMELEGGILKVQLEDNGKGMPGHIVEAINQGVYLGEGSRSHIGMQNALYRIKLYYEGQAHVHVESQEGAYTRVFMELPVV